MADRKESLREPLGKTSDRRWLGLFLYLVFAIFMLWLWQEAYRRATVYTIPYSDFKAYLDRGEIVKCTIGKNEIQGQINPKPKHEIKGKPQEPEGVARPLNSVPGWCSAVPQRRAYVP